MSTVALDGDARRCCSVPKCSNEWPCAEHPPTLDEYRAAVIPKKCKWCGTVLPSIVQCYSHPGGWPVSGFAEYQWLYIQCTKCGYDFALWKLGVPRAA